MLVTAIIPCLNEEHTIGKVVTQLLNLQLPIVVLVVDNNSSDSTSRIATAAGATVVKELVPGKGAAVRRGFLNLPQKTTHVFLVDGDGTYSISQIRLAIELMDKNSLDMIIGKRIAIKQEGGLNPVFPKYHALGNHFLTLVFRVLFRTKITDSLSGWRLMSRAFVESFNGTSNGFQVESELNSHSYAINISTCEVEISYHPRHIGSLSKLNTFQDGCRIFLRNLQMFKNERPFMAFVLLALPWLGISTYFMLRVLYGWNRYQEVRLPSLLFLITSFLIFIQLWAAGIILERSALHRKTLLRIEYKRFKAMSVRDK